MGRLSRKGTKQFYHLEASAKITCRLVADQKPAKIYELLKVHIGSNVPKGLPFLWINYLETQIHSGSKGAQLKRNCKIGAPKAI